MEVGERSQMGPGHRLVCCRTTPQLYSTTRSLELIRVETWSRPTSSFRRHQTRSTVGYSPAKKRRIDDLADTMDHHGVQSAPSNWPGERNPTQQDVPQASELPDQAFLTKFKNALLALEGPKEYQERRVNPSQRSHHGQQSINNRPFTYPLSVLADFPPLPSSSDLADLRAVYATTWCAHAYFNREPIPEVNAASLPPYLSIAYACIGSILYSIFPSRDHNARSDLRSSGLARDLFLAGYKLSTFMVEVDNRQSRTSETILAV